MAHSKKVQEELNDSLRPETSLNNKRPFTDEGTRNKQTKNPKNITIEQNSYIRNAATASNFKSIPIPKHSPVVLEKMGFLEKNQRNDEYKPMMMPNIRNINNFIGGKNASYKAYPKNMILDKERLYEENLSLKSLINGFKQENLQLKTKLSNLDRENFKFEKIIYDIDYINNKKTSKAHFNWTPEVSNPTIINMRRQLKENQAVMVSKDKEIDNLKKAPKMTRISELETELKQFAEETVRLRKMLDEALKVEFPENKNGDFHLEEKLLIQGSAITALNKERYDLITIIQNLNDQVMRKSLKIEELENQLNLFRNDKQKKNFQIKKVNNQGHINQNSKESGKKIQQKSIHTEKEENNKSFEEKQQEETLRKELEQKSNELSSLAVRLTQKDKKITELEHKIKEISSDFSEKIEIEAKEKSGLSIKLEKERKEAKLLTQKYHALLGSSSKQAEKDYLDEEKPDIFPEKSPTSSKLITSATPLPEKRRMVKVNYYDIEEIGTMIRYNLKLKNIPIEKIQEFLKENPEKPEYSIGEMVLILEQEPFALKELDKRVLLARYMIEDNTLDYVLFDNNLTAPMAVIRSVLKKTLGSYTLFSKQEVKLLHSEISAGLNRVKPTLEDTLKASSIKRGASNKITTKDDLLNCLKFCEIHLNNKQMEYFMMKLWEAEGKMDVFVIDKIFKIFDISSIIKEESQMFSLEEIVNDKETKDKKKKKTLDFEEKQEKIIKNTKLYEIQEQKHDDYKEKLKETPINKRNSSEKLNHKISEKFESKDNKISEKFESKDHKPKEKSIKLEIDIEKPTKSLEKSEHKLPSESSDKKFKEFDSKNYQEEQKIHNKESFKKKSKDFEKEIFEDKGKFIKKEEKHHLEEKSTKKEELEYEENYEDIPEDNDPKKANLEENYQMNQNFEENHKDLQNYEGNQEDFEIMHKYEDYEGHDDKFEEKEDDIVNDQKNNEFEFNKHSSKSSNYPPKENNQIHDAYEDNKENYEENKVREEVSEEKDEKYNNNAENIEEGFEENEEYLEENEEEIEEEEKVEENLNNNNQNSHRTTYTNTTQGTQQKLFDEIIDSRE